MQILVQQDSILHSIELLSFSDKTPCINRSKQPPLNHINHVRSWQTPAKIEQKHTIILGISPLTYVPTARCVFSLSRSRRVSTTFLLETPRKFRSCIEQRHPACEPLGKSKIPFRVWFFGKGSQSCPTGIFLNGNVFGCRRIAEKFAF